jgi:hypothetical protein
MLSLQRAVLLRSSNPVFDVGISLLECNLGIKKVLSSYYKGAQGRSKGCLSFVRLLRRCDLFD